MEEEVTEVVEPAEEVSTTEMDEAALDTALSEVEGEPDPAVEEPEPVVETEPAEIEADKQAKLEKQLKDKEEFIQRRNSEVGELRRQIAELQTIKQQVDPDTYYDNPVEAVNQVLQERERQAHIQNLHQTAIVKENELNIKQAVPEIDTLIDDIADLATKEGAHPDIVRRFKANPYGAVPDLVIQLAHRVKVEKENSTLKAEIERLKKAPQDVLKKVEAAANSSRPLTASVGNSGGPAVSDKQTHLLSDKELDDLLK